MWLRTINFISKIKNNSQTIKKRKKIEKLAVFMLFAVCFLPASVSAEPLVLKGNTIYYGLFHAHNSEGGDDNKREIATVDYAYKFARDRGKLDFFGLTPHSHMISDKFFARIRREYKNYSGPSYAPLYGSEWGVLSSTGHIGILGSKKMLCERLVPKTNLYEYLEAIFDLIVNDKACHAVLNHPETFDFGYYYNPIADERINSVEVFSGSAFETRIDMARSSSSYEDQLLVLLNRGWHVGSVANQDNHFPTYGIATQTRTGIVSEHLSSASVMKALKERKCFGTQDKNLAVVMTAKKGSKEYMMGSVITNATGQVTINVHTYDQDGEIPAQIILFSDIVDCGEIGKKVISVKNAEDLEYTFTPDRKERFYIAQVIQEDGHRAWTSPIWVSTLNKYQFDLNKLLLVKKQFKTADFHYKYIMNNVDVEEDSYFLKKLQWSKNYLANISRIYSEDVYERMFNSGGNSLRNILADCGEFLENLPPHDAVLFFDDLKEMADKLALTSDEGEFIESFIRNTKESIDQLYLKKTQLMGYAKHLMKAKNYAGAAMIYTTLEKRFPEDREEFQTCLIEVFNSLQAYQAVIDVSDEILSDPSLNRETAIDIYIAKGKTYLRSSSQSTRKGDKKHYIQLAKDQFKQLFKDYRKFKPGVKAMVEELIGDCAYKQMRDKNLDAKAMYKETIKYFNRALTDTEDIGKILDLNEKISNATMRFNNDLQTIKDTIIDFEALREEFGPSRDTDMLLKNLGDLKLKVAQKTKEPEEKKALLKSSVDYFKSYIRQIKPKTRDNLNFQVANILKQMGQNSKAIGYYKKIESESFKSRKLENSLFNMIYCYANMKKYDEAIEVAQRLLNNFPNYKPCYLNYKKEQVKPMDSIVGRKIQKLQAEASGLDFSSNSDLDNPDIEYFFIPESLEATCDI